MHQKNSIYALVATSSKMPSQIRSNNDLDKSTFKQYYQTELTDINNNLAFSERINKSIHALEPEYQRISNSVSNVLKELAQSNLEFSQELKRDSIQNMK